MLRADQRQGRCDLLVRRDAICLRREAPEADQGVDCRVQRAASPVRQGQGVRQQLHRVLRQRPFPGGIELRQIGRRVCRRELPL